MRGLASRRRGAGRLALQSGDQGSEAVGGDARQRDIVALRPEVAAGGAEALLAGKPEGAIVAGVEDIPDPGEGRLFLLDRKSVV